MLSQLTCLVAALAATALASPVNKRANPTVYLAGDSTMAKTSNGLDGMYLSISPPECPLTPFRLGPRI